MFRRVGALCLQAEPSIPILSAGQKTWDKGRKALRQCESDRMFADIGFAHCLEPHCRPIGFKADQAECGAGAELTKASSQHEPEGLKLLIHPGLNRFKPTQ